MLVLREPIAARRRPLSRSFGRVSHTAALLGLTGALFGCTTVHPRAMPTAATPVAASGLEGRFSFGSAETKAKRSLSDVLITVLRGRDRPFRPFGGDVPVTHSPVTADGRFKVSLAPGDYSVGVYTVFFARGRIPCAKMNVKIAPRASTAISLHCV